MSRDENTPNNPAANRRRSSFTANKLSEMFNASRAPTSPSNNSPPPQSNPVFPNAAAARRLSVSGALGLNSASAANSSGPSSATTPRSGAWGFRRGSMSTSAASDSSGSGEESAIDESGDAVGQPPSPLGRRMSFGARAMGQMRGNEGFNWAENIRNRQGRAGSTGTNTTSASAARNEQMQSQQDRLAQPPKAAPPAPAPTAMKKERPAPDHFQERILKGDFYMD